MKKFFTFHLSIIFLIGVINCFNYNDSYASDDEDEILNAFLKNAVEKAKKNIEAKGRIETEDVIPFMLKFQYNDIAHLKEDIAHLRKEMVTKTEFNALKKEIVTLKKEMVTKTEFNVLKSKVDFLQWIMLFGIAFLAVLQGYDIFNKRKS